MGGGGAGPSGGGGGLGGANQARLVLGPFTVSPAFGFILPGGQQVITVECIAETPEKFEEVSNRNCGTCYPKIYNKYKDSLF